MPRSVWLGDLTDAERAAYLAGPLQAFTPRTLTDPAALERDLETIRSRGYALGDGKLDLDVRAVAAAIRLETENRVAALSISCPAFRFPDEKIGEYGGWVRQAAERIGAALASGCRAAKRADGAGIRVERRVRREREQAS